LHTQPQLLAPMQLGIAYGWLDVCCMLVPHPVTSSSSSIFSCSKFNCQMPEAREVKLEAKVAANAAAENSCGYC
jgi:hypothetical protein